MVDNIILMDILKGIRVLANFYLFFMFIMAIMNLLGVFGVINIFNGGPLSNIYFILRRIIDPPISWINRFVPNMGGLDLGFLILVVILWIVVDVCDYYIAMLSTSSFVF